MPIPSFIAPSTKTFLNIGRELVVGAPVVGATTIPIEQSDYSPEDVPKFLPDESIRGVMTPLFNEVRGVESATWSYGGPAFLDTLGFWLDNTFGDMSTIGTTPTNATTLSTLTAVGATTATVGSISGYANNSIVQIDSGSLAEVVQLSAVPSGNLLTFGNNPLRFAHNPGASIATVTGPYTHTYAILNTGSGQPPTHSMTDYTGLTSSVGARTYPCCCVSQMDFTMNTEQLFKYKASGVSFQSAAAGTTPTAQTTFTVPQAAWEATISVGGSPVNSIGEYTVSIKRKLQTYWTATNTQTPYIIARGGLGLTYGINYTVPSDESPLTNMLTSGPLAIAYTLDNGLSGTNHLKIVITSTTAQFVKSKPERSAVLVGYQDSAEAVANATDAGGSGGIGPGTVQLINNVATY